MVTVFTKEKALELRKNYQAIETIWKFIQSYNEPLRKNKDFKEALKIAQDNGINTALYNDCLENWDKVSEDVGRIIYDIEKQVDAETATKLRLLASYIIWPIKFSRAAQAVMYSQHWFFTKPPKDKDLLPIELEPISPEEFKQRNFVYGGWLEENFFTTSNELVRAIVYGEDRYYEYNFQDLPVKSLLKKIKATSTKWGEAAREAAKKEKFRFDKDFTGDYPYTVYERERLDLTWNAAPEELRNEHTKDIRRLVKEVWEYHQKKLCGEEYDTLPSTSVTKATKQILNNPTRTNTTRKGEMTSERHYMTGDIIIKYQNSNNDLIFTMEKAKELFTQRAQKGTKVFNFLLKKLNEQNYGEQTAFLTSELVDAGIYANKDSAKKGLKKILDKMYYISLEGKTRSYRSGKRADTNYKKTRVISAWENNRDKWVVPFAPIIRETATSITILPSWANKLNDRSYLLLDYIFYLVRQNTGKIKETGKFNISLNAIAAHLGLPTPEEVNHSNQVQCIMDPIMESIAAIERARPNTELKTTPFYNLDGSIHDFLAGYLEIEVDQYTQSVMTERALAQEKEIKKKQKLIEKAKQKQIEKKLKEASKPEAAMEKNA